MNAETMIEPSLPAKPFDAAWNAVNTWRGRCIDAFARAEQAVTETLLAMAEAPRGTPPRLRHLVGQRFDDLSIAVGAEGPFHAEGKTALKMLTDFRQHDELRALMCHGVGKVTLNRRGRWTVVTRVLALRARQPVRTVFVFEEHEADALARELARASQNLCSELGQVRAAIK